MEKQVTKYLSITKDDTQAVLKALAEVTALQVLVGVPEATAAREDDPLNNATIGYLMEFGSPAANIPARAWLVPGVEKVLPQCMAQIKAATRAALDGEQSKAKQYLNGAGNLAMEGAKHEMQNGNFAPLKPSTIENRFRQRQDQTQRQSEKDYMKFYYQLSAQGASADRAAAIAQAEVGIRPLLNTLELLHSVTYVIRNSKQE